MAKWGPSEFELKVLDFKGKRAPLPKGGRDIPRVRKDGGGLN